MIKRINKTYQNIDAMFHKIQFIFCDFVDVDSIVIKSFNLEVFNSITDMTKTVLQLRFLCINNFN